MSSSLEQQFLSSCKEQFEIKVDYLLKDITNFINHHHDCALSAIQTNLQIRKDMKEILSRDYQVRKLGDSYFIDPLLEEFEKIEKLASSYRSFE